MSKIYYTKLMIKCYGCKNSKDIYRVIDITERTLEGYYCSSCVNKFGNAIKDLSNGNN